MSVDRSLYSDLYKDAYGFRPPRFSDSEVTLTDEEFIAETNRLQAIIEDNLLVEAAYEVGALNRFRETLASYSTRFGVDPVTAIRWWMEAEDPRSDIRVPQSVEAFLYDVGLPFSAWPEFQKMITDYYA